MEDTKRRQRATAGEFCRWHGLYRLGFGHPRCALHPPIVLFPFGHRIWCDAVATRGRFRCSCERMKKGSGSLRAATALDFLKG